VSDGDHTLEVCAAGTSPDPANGECYERSDEPRPDPTPATWTWTVDTHAPTGLSLGEPAAGATGLSPTPTFTWHPADGGLSGIDHYELFIDGAKAANASCSSDPCSANAPAPLTEGSHAWKVRALDRAGNVQTSEERTFGSGSPPTASFSIAPNPVLAGRAVTFDGAASSDTSGPIKRYEWDLDGDGTFETDTGTTAQTTRTYAAPGTVKVKLRVTDGVGLTNSAETPLTVTAPTIPGQVGVTINNGAQFTNRPAVTLNVVSPPSITSLLISNDGGFLAAKTFAPARQIPWVLDSSGPERLPKTVYLRFVFGTFATPNYTDDIILDERPPVVSQATVAPAAAAATAAHAAKAKAWKLKVKASDSNSGVAGIQVTANKRKAGKLVKYKRKLKVKSPSRPKFLRAKDRAGNYSPWKKLR
jgi:PKD repeat protein